MRFHTVAALYVLIFARFFHFSRGEYILLLLTISSVLALEAVNTAIEELCDKVTLEKDERIRRVKDAAAGAVLVAACFAAVVGVVLFWDGSGWQEAAAFYGSHPLNLIALVLLSAVSVLYVVFGIPPFPKKQQDGFEKHGKNNNKAKP